MDYLICTNGRSGSNWLVQMMASTRKLGHPLEFFNPGVIDEQHDIVGVPRDCSDREYWVAVRRRYATDGVQGAKVGWYAMHRAIEAVEPSYYIHLVRLDTLGQAISLYRAAQTKVWIRTNRQPDAIPQPPIDAAEIKRVQEGILTRDEWFREYFKSHGIDALEVVYEDIMADPIGQVRRIAEFLKVPLPADFEPTWSTLIQRDEWTERARKAVLGLE